VISRQWRGLAHVNQAEVYEEHLRSHTFPALKEIPGFIDASILRRRIERGVEFLIVTRWASMEAIRRFAGWDAEAAVVPAEVDAMMIEYDRRVKHFEVVDLLDRPVHGV
jgi:heme-degrading monooxygenase HmoA